MTVDKYFVQLLTLLIIVDMAELQKVDLSIIRHTTVGNDIISHCNEKTVQLKRQANLNTWRVYHKLQKVERLYYSFTKQALQKHIANRYHLVSYESGAGTFDLFFMIKNASVKDEGLYYCEVQNANDQSYITASMLYLYVHETEKNNPCKDNWLYYRTKKTCVRAILDQMSWDEGRKYCKYHHNADLVKITDKTMDEFVTSVSDRDTPYWIGLKTEAGIAGYHWLDSKKTGLGSSHTYWAINFPKDIKGRSCAAKGGKGDAAWRNMKCDVNNGIVCERTPDKASVWRAPSLLEAVISSAIMLLVITALACCFLGIYPNRSTCAKTLGFLGRHDVVSEIMTASTVIVIYDSELNDLFKE